MCMCVYHTSSVPVMSLGSVCHSSCVCVPFLLCVSFLLGLSAIPPMSMCHSSWVCVPFLPPCGRMYHASWVGVPHLMQEWPVSGWYLSMVAEDSFMRRLQPVRDIPVIMERNNRFGTYNDKTLGMLLVRVV